MRDTTMKKIISAILALVMVLAVMPTFAFAGTADNVKQYGKSGGYMAFGDSITRGCGANENYHEDYINLDCRTIEGSYSLAVARAVGCTINENASSVESNYWPICYPGQSLAATMDLLDIEDDFDDTEYTHSEEIGVYQDYFDKMLTIYGDIGKKAETASLITVELGMADVLNRGIEITNVDGSVVSIIKDMISNFYEGYEYVCRAFPIFLAQLREWNKNAEILVLSAFNPVANVKLQDSSILAVCDVLSILTNAMNVKYKQWAKKYDCTYVDIANTDCAASENDWSVVDDEFTDNGRLSAHPSPNGYAYIARQILSVLPEENGTETPEKSTEIVVDLGRFKSVSMVKLDGIPISKSLYTFDEKNNTLTVHTKTALHGLLTVYIVGEDYKIGTATYRLSYDGKYTPHRIYVSNEIFPIMRQVFLKLLNLKTNNSDSTNA